MFAERRPEGEFLVMEAAPVVNGRQPRSQDFCELWTGHYDKVLACQPIFISKYARGGGGAVKFVFQERKEWHGKVCHVYTHCHNTFPPMWVMIHNYRPEIVVRMSVETRDDGLVKAIQWHYAATGQFITATFYYANVSSMRL